MAKRRDRLRFGKHFGQLIDTVPVDYLCYVMNNFKRVPIAVTRELTRRSETDGEDAPIAKQMLDEIEAKKQAELNRPAPPPKKRKPLPLHVLQKLRDDRRNEYRPDMFPR